MVALSVSTSANESSDFTLSPTLKFHLLITPSVIVSLKAGIRITVAGVFEVSTFGAAGAAGFASAAGAGAVAGFSSAVLASAFSSAAGAGLPPSAFKTDW